MWRLLTCAFLAVLCSFIETRHLSCPFLSRQVLSHDTNLLATGNVTASSADLVSPAQHLVSRSNAPVRLWCSEPHAGQRHHLNLSFTRPVVIEHIISAGFSNGYVNNFSVQYSRYWEGELAVYQDSHIQQYFIVPHIDAVFTLEDPPVVSRLHLLVHGGLVAPSSRLCWHLTLLGCLLSDTLEPLDDSSPQSTANGHPMELPPTPFICTPGEDGGRDGLGVVMGSLIAVMVLMLALAVILALLACVWCFKHSNHGLRRFWPSAFRMNAGLPAAALSDTDTRTVLHNSTIYKRRHAPLSPAAGSTDTMIENEGSGGNFVRVRNFLLENHPPNSNTQDQTITGICSVLYDDPQSPRTPAPEASPYEVPAVVPGVHRESMVDNPMYSKPYDHMRPSGGQASRIAVVPNECYCVNAYDLDPSYSYASMEQPSAEAVRLTETSAVYDEIQ